jgi:hypothetical protein
MFWQIAAEISPFFLLTLFTLFLLLLPSYSVSIYFVLPVDRFFYTSKSVYNKQKKKIKMLLVFTWISSYSMQKHLEDSRMKAIKCRVVTLARGESQRNDVSNVERGDQSHERKARNINIYKLTDN